MQLLEQEVSDAFEERKNLAKKSGEEARDKNAVSNDDDVWNYHCHYYGSCVSFVTVSNCFSNDYQSNC